MYVELAFRLLVIASTTLPFIKIFIALIYHSDPTLSDYSFQFVGGSGISAWFGV